MPALNFFKIMHSVLRVICQMITDIYILSTKFKFVRIPNVHFHKWLSSIGRNYVYDMEGKENLNMWELFRNTYNFPVFFRYKIIKLLEKHEANVSLYV